ncbi:polysaccharide biosynthesis tyrosine autokinase [Nodosilinea sp. LEGE 07298]|uniref:GumC family protein n=1 Tax=Nodosilinea sp. LEGE 07298 TaxID=2777970 RepID=UPI00187F1623|nr:polysaccharide biosynthesis tyrosine autokinase [Nodosilinea sp. LEGE 07298]MBE9109115.1 polysaccharide biosynthesis tyrosine autokinase [Nodosilinea sp. LEGE 07298]
MPFPPSSTPRETNGNGNGHGPLRPEFVPVMAPPSLVEKGDDIDLNRLVGVLKRRAGVFLGVAALSFGGLTLWHLSRPPAYSGSVNLLVEPVTNAPPVGLEEVVGAQGSRGASRLDYDSQIRVLRGPAVIEPILTDIQRRYPNITYNALLSRLSIIQEGDSKVLRVSYNAADPEVVSFVLTQVIEGFVDYSVQDRQGDLRRGLTFLDEQLQEKWREVEAIESDLSEFQKRYDIVNVNATSESVTQRLNQMLADQEQLRVELTAMEPLYDNLRDQVGFDPDTAIRVANLNESPTYQALLGDLREIEQTIAAESARFQTDTPMIEALADQRQQLLPLLEAEAQRLVGEAVEADTLGYKGSVSQGLMQQLVDTANQRQVLQTQDQAIGQTVQQLQAEIQRLADLSRSFQQIDRELTVAESSLNQLLASRQELRLQMARQASPWEIISPLNESGITKTTNLPRKLLLSTVVGLMMGGVAALLRDRIDQAFHSVDELVKATQLPNLATVPNAPALQKQPLLMAPDLAATMADVLSQSQSPDKLYTSFSFAEAFYSLEANLRMLSSDVPVQVVALTSSVPGEGKSTICAHLAIAAANMGRRVLLIDGDLRKPSQHLLFGQPNRQGLSDLITQAIEDPNDLVLTLPGNPNLHLLTAGARPPAPGRLLSSRKMQQITEQYRRHYDLIIFDTPPLAGMIDAKLTAAHADGLLLVVRLHRSERSEIQRVLADLGNTAQAPLLGLVVNGVPQSRQSGYDYYYGYYGRPQMAAGLEKNV